ncbi:BgTH12-02916 [Blumeria graminis f. sp. triticale]|uniref:Bgt-4464 n=3 Tax=Blumeria graminis TaxID=34373 RepID=A0A061HL84_BLUGR|nr:hypothetical protein BGT96224_4464 [Blumeria graminis f. sp. tritici 96224]CAD6503249.1 BgTH12-02916 [Blumeria graminis f. sp. triticale]VDB89239.1 Bgt-4464 [Blumeria graminis f. sp. tritici]
MISTAYNRPSSVLVPHVVTNSHLHVLSMVPTWERGTEFPYYATDDSQWSSAPWRGEFPHNLIFSPDIECFQGANIDSDYAWQSIWTYPSTEDQVKAQQNVGFDSTLQTGLSYGGYMSADSGEQSSTALLTPSPERSFEDHAVFPSGQVENLDPYQTIYPGIGFISYPEKIGTKLFLQRLASLPKPYFQIYALPTLGNLVNILTFRHCWTMYKDNIGC